MNEKKINKIDETSGDAPGKIISNISAVLHHLTGDGWQIAKTTLYRHKKEGRILPGVDGSYSLKAVDFYARSFLKRQATSKKISEAEDELHRKKLEQELKNLELKYAREKLGYEREQGLFIPRDQMDIELATRAGILVAGLKHWVQTNAADWIAAMSGDTKKVGELINLMNKDLDEHINTYASNREYEVIIDAVNEKETTISEAQNEMRE